MPSFGAEFRKNHGQPIVFGDKIIHWYDKIPIGNVAEVAIRILSTNSTEMQCVVLENFGKFIFSDREYKEKVVIWEYDGKKNAFPIEDTCKVESKDGYLYLCNGWEQMDHTGYPHLGTCAVGAGMIIEEIPNGKRYYCNDWHPDENFDDIVFEIILLSTSPMPEPKKKVSPQKKLNKDKTNSE